jgi:predicted dinucleotide-binding enzyme
MKIAVLGTGMVGRALAGRLAGLGHQVAVGTRSVSQTLSRLEPDAKGTPPYAQWQEANPGVQLLPFAEAGAHGEIIVNATAGANSLAVLEAVGAANLAGKPLLDLALPLDYSQGRPPQLAFANTDSLGEQIQRAFPEAHVVKTLNTMHVNLMIEPGRVPGRHDVFVAGDVGGAKETVKGLLTEFGWPRGTIIDLGGIRASRATEMYAPLLFALFEAFGTSDLNIAIVRRAAA